MAIIDTPSTNGNPTEALKKMLEVMEKSEIEAMFVDENKKAVLTRAFIELTLQDYSLQAQNPQIFNKWLAVDEKVNKAIRQFKSDLLQLLTGQAQMNAAQQTLQAEVPPEAPNPTPPAEGQARPRRSRSRERRTYRARRATGRSRHRPSSGPPSAPSARR